LSESEEEQVLANYTVNDGNDKSIKEGNYTFIYRPKFHIRQKLYELTLEDDNVEARSASFTEFVSNHIISKETYEAVAFVRTKVDLNNDEIYKQVVGDFDSYSFSNPNDDDATVLGVKKPPYFALGRVRISTLRNENETFSQLNSIAYIGVFLRLVTYSHLP
ncbi:TPA: hypothetical protein ACX3KE_004630, partial [Enterobacter kobei]